MAFPKVKISDDSGNTVDVTSNALDVNIAGGTADIDIGDVSLLLGGTAASTNAGTMDAQTLRVTLATDDTHWGTVGAGSDVDGVAHGQLRYIGTSVNALNTDLSTVASNTGVAKDVLNFAASTTGGQYAEGDGGFLATGVRNDILATLVSVDHDHAPFQVNAEGALYTTGNTLQGGALHGENFTVMGESKTIDGSALPNVTAEGRNIRLAASTSGILYTCLTDDAGASDLGTTITTHLSEIEGAVETIEGAIDGSEMQVDIVSSATLSVNSHAVTNAGTFAVQSTLQANSGVDIGDVDVTSLPASTNTIEIVGDAAEDAAVAGNPVLVGGRYDSSPRSLDDGDVGAIAVTLEGYPIVSLDSNWATGTNGYGSAFHVAGDGFSQATDATLSIAAVLSDALAAPANTTDGDWCPLQVDTQGALYTTHGMTAMVSGANDTISDSTAEQLDGSTSGLDVACRRVDIMAHTSNTGYIFVGDSGVVANGSGGGISLAAGDFYSIDVDNLNDIWLIATVDAENVTYNYFT